MDSFYIVTNKDKDPEFQTTRFVKEYLEKRGKKCTIRENSAEGGGSYKYTDASVIPEDVDCVLVLGGDGTLLQASRDLTERDLPLLGINMGTLGYLAEVDRRGIEPALERLLAGDYQLVSRMMIYGEVYHQGKKVMEDPTPLEVQMRLYEQDVNTAVIENSNRGKEQKGVDGA